MREQSQSGDGRTARVACALEGMTALLVQRKPVVKLKVVTLALQRIVTLSDNVIQVLNSVNLQVGRAECTGRRKKETRARWFRTSN